jgi:hypothetical protein
MGHAAIFGPLRSCEAAPTAQTRDRLAFQSTEIYL